jgi:hypothetical protein
MFQRSEKLQSILAQMCGMSKTKDMSSIDNFCGARRDMTAFLEGRDF